MKCPECGTNRKHKEGMACSCGYKFILDPKKTPYVSDGKFLALIRSVSGNDTYYFTRNQLYAQWCRRKNRHRIVAVVCLVIAAGMLSIPFMVGAKLVPMIFLSAMGALLACIGIGILVSGPPKESEVDNLLMTWQNAGGKIDKLIEKPRLQPPPPEWSEPDIYDYGVERLVIVERNLLVDLLVLNQFHAQQNALVISEKGYPEYLVDRARDALISNPELPVFLLHDATTIGMGMGERLATGNMLPLDGHPVIDLGLFPKDVERMPGMKPVGAKNKGYHVPVDYLLFATLAGGMTTALAQEVALGQLMAQQQSWSDGGDTVVSFG